MPTLSLGFAKELLIIFHLSYIGRLTTIPIHSIQCVYGGKRFQTISDDIAIQAMVLVVDTLIVVMDKTIGMKLFLK